LHSPAQDSSNQFADDIKGVFETLWRRRTAFLLGFIPVIVAAAVYLYFVMPQFTASATLVLDPRRQAVTTSPEVLPDAAPDSSVVETQVELILSRAVLGRAVSALGHEQIDMQPPSVLARLLNTLQIFGSQTAASPTDQRTREEVIDQVRGRLEVSRSGLTYAIKISYSGYDSQRSANVTNAIAAAYLDYQTELKQQATKDATLWLREQVTELRERVAASESAVDRYRSKSGLLTARGATSTESQLTSLDLGFNEAQQSLTQARAKLDNYRNAWSSAGAAEAAKIVATSTMQALRSQYTALINQQAQLSPTLGPSHPQMLELKRQFDALQAEMNTEAGRTIEELRSDVAIAERRVDGLLAIRDKSRTQLAEDNAANVELTQLQANAQTLRTLYEDMLSRLQQVTAQESLSQINATIVSNALAPRSPSSPRFDLVVAAALAVGLAVGAFSVMLAQLADSTVVNPQELERRVQLPIVALVPRLRRRDLKISGRRISLAEFVPGKPLSLFAESFRNLRVAVQQSVGRTDALVIQITSGTFAEGKTVSSMAFAQAAAMDGRRVLLIDADVRRKSLTKYLGITTSTGLMELLRGEVSVEDVIMSGADRNRPDVLPLSTNDAGTQDCFSGPFFGSLLQRLKQEFDLIIIDSAPVLVVAESLVLASRVDAVVLVARWSSTPLQTILKAMEAMNRAGAHVAGMLLTQVNIKKVTEQAYGKGHYPALMKYYQH
jgi:capsular exopolysaccharide synthesis family protein